MLRKCFARQLVKGNGSWWFDMWGGWFRDPVLLRELRAMREIYADSLTTENLFLNDGKTEPVRRAMAACESNGTPYLCLTEAKPRYAPAELRDFCDQNGVHVFCRTDDIVYISPRCLALHATEAGEKAVDLGGKYRYRELLTEHGANGEGRILSVTMQANETKLFSLTKKDAE